MAAVASHAAAAPTTDAETAIEPKPAAPQQASPSLPGHHWRRLVTEGDAALAAGRVDQARRDFEQAASMAHEAEIELGILRTQMQAGEYRHALAFAAHTAGVHLDEVEGAVFYAWLLNLGGQVQVAEQILKQAEASAPASPAVQAALRRFQSGQLVANDAALLKLPARLAPFAIGVGPEGDAVDRPVRSVATALLLADGRHALAPRAALPVPMQALWLRNGLGQTVRARLDQQSDEQDEPQSDKPQTDLGLALLTLAYPLPTAGSNIIPPRDAFSGSPAFAVGFPLDALGTPAWPWMRTGFLGPLVPGDATGLHKLGVALPGGYASSCGGPVYDQGGRFIGMALHVGASSGSANNEASGGTNGKIASDQAQVSPSQPQSPDRMVPVGALIKRFGDRFGTRTSEPRPSLVGADEIYERALRSSLQVLAPAP